MLYNDYWHGFWVRSWWPRGLWQAVTLWLVNRGLAVRRGRPVEQVCNQKETTWYENPAFRFRQSDKSEESRTRDTQPIRGVSVVSEDTFCKGGGSIGTPGSRKKIWGKKKSPLWVYVSPSISQTSTNCVPLSRIKWERDIFYCFVSLIEFRKSCLVISLMNP